MNPRPSVRCHRLYMLSFVYLFNVQHSNEQDCYTRALKYLAAQSKADVAASLFRGLINLVQKLQATSFEGSH